MSPWIPARIDFKILAKVAYPRIFPGFESIQAGQASIINPGIQAKATFFRFIAKGAR
jgi:hypothetical protein